MTKSVNEREIVLAALLEVTEKGAYSHQILRDVLFKYQYLEKRERAFITRVTEGTLEHLIEIDYILDQFSKVKVRKMKPVIRGILRSSVYQLKYMDSVPDRAVCSEAVKLAARKGFSGLKGYVNGVLRNVARGLADVAYPRDRKQELSVRYSCPEWIVDLWQKEFGQETAEMMIRSLSGERPLTVRCCRSRISVEELRERLAQEGVKTEIHPYLPHALYISGYDHLEGLGSFREGLFAVQDVSSMLVGELAAPCAGAQILDVCAAPGGKSLHAAEELLLAAAASGRPEEQGMVEARDLTEYKVDLIRENIERFRMENVQAVCRDAAVPDPDWKEKADIVLADLPCSGLGVMGKKPDLRYRISPADIKDLAALQKKILSCAQACVKPGGTLIYSTCTVSREENTDNVRWFLKEYPEFLQEDISGRLCPELRGALTDEGCLQLLPGIHKSDGFFIAKLRKREGGT